MSQINITIDIDLNDPNSFKKAQDFVLRAFGGNSPEVENLQKAAGEVAKKSRTRRKVEKITPEITATETVEGTTGVIQEKEETVGETITMDELRELVHAKAKNNKDAIKAKLAEIGIKKIPDLEPSMYPAFVEFLNTLA